MATSSIFANVRITDPQQAEVFVEALDASAMDQERIPSAPVIPLATNILNYVYLYSVYYS